MAEPECVVDSANLLGETPLWSAAEQALYWVDIRGRAIQRWRFGDAPGTFETWPMPSEIGAICHAPGGKLVAALRHGFHLFDPATGALSLIMDPEPSHPENRLNDAKIDPAGRLWCGSVKDPDPAPVGVLYRLDAGGRCEAMADGIAMPNALGWSPDGRTMYFGDSFAATIWAYAFDPASGAIAGRRVFASVPKEDGVPDGSCVDADGYVWNAHMFGARVTRYAPDGTIDRVVVLPADKVTCCAFGGPELDTLFITTGRFGLTDEELARQPHAGGIFAYRAGVKGRSEPVFGEGL